MQGPAAAGAMAAPADLIRQLDELQRDTLTEVMNLGMGRAANALNELVGTHIALRVPTVSMVTSREAQARIRALGWVKLSSVQLRFSGSLAGNVALLFPCDSAVKLVSLLTGDDAAHSDVDGMRRATLEEAGNILLNGVVGAVSNLLDDEITFSVPYYSEDFDIVSRLVPGDDDAGAPVIFSRAQFQVDEYSIQGEILLYFEIESLESLIEALDAENAGIA